MMQYWFGADPGGIGCFGVAKLSENGIYETKNVSSVDEALDFMKHPTHVGIDCPLWWSSGRGGGRSVDQRLRRKYGISSGTIQSVNSLKGAVLAQGIMLAMRLRETSPNCEISETHPKALLRALGLLSVDLYHDWPGLADRFSLAGPRPETEHERDALVSAVVMREATTGSWTDDISFPIARSELNPKHLWFGSVSYWWPETV